ncbi:hypothetical protein BGZ49_010653 [Haplosporangium sp. Z 27]|nr:hypothetical protein BGZ49_010653 [Haplosporangium sp. Z 27]
MSPLNSSGTPHALEIPEIVFKVVHYLDITDVLTCSSVSRSFYSSFSPFVWENLHFGQHKPDDYNEPLARNLFPGHIIQPMQQSIDIRSELLSLGILNKAPLIRSLSIHSHTTLIPLVLGRECTQLDSITMEGLSVNDEKHTREHWDSCRKIFKRNQSSLKSISLINWEYDSHKKIRHGQPMWSPIQRLAEATNLRFLSLEKCMIRGRHSRIFWTTCERLESLRLDDVRLDIPRSPLNHRMDIETTEYNFTRMRDLRLRSIQCVLPTRLLNRLIRLCSNIQVLYWNIHNHDRETLSEFCDLYAASAWPELDWIVIERSLADDSLSRILQAAKKPFRRLDFSFSNIQPSTFQLLRERHFSTIRKISLMNHSRHKRRWAIDVLTSCPLLEIFKVDDVTAQEISESGPWICKGLKKLVAFIDMGFKDNANNRRLTPEELEQCHEVYSRLAWLKELQVLDMLNSYIGANIAAREQMRTLVPLPVRLKAGLGQLAGLIKIKDICFWNGRQAIHKKELVWMIDHWKRFKSITCGWQALPRHDAYQVFAYHPKGRLSEWLAAGGIEASRCLYYNESQPDEQPCEDWCETSESEDDSQADS